jgi:hypothetical protein
MPTEHIDKVVGHTAAHLSVSFLYLLHNGIVARVNSPLEVVVSSFISNEVETHVQLHVIPALPSFRLQSLPELTFNHMGNVRKCDCGMNFRVIRSIDNTIKSGTA